MKKVLMLVVATLSFTGVFAQGLQEDKAHNYFLRLEYTQAQEMYLNLIEKGQETGVIVKNLADTYYYEGDLKNAHVWYTRLLDKHTDTIIEADCYYRAAESLQGTDEKKYDALMKKYRKEVQKEARIYSPRYF